MSHRVIVSTTGAPVFFCPVPLELTIGFPPTCPGPNTVTLANGAVVDLNLLGEIISDFCPGVAEPVNIVLTGTQGFIDP